MRAHATTTEPILPLPSPRASTCSCCTWPTPASVAFYQRLLDREPLDAFPAMPPSRWKAVTRSACGPRTASARRRPSPAIAAKSPSPSPMTTRCGPARALADAGRAHRATTCRRSLRIDLRRPGSRRSSHPRSPALNVAVFTPVQDPARRPREHGGFARNRAMHDPTAAGGPIESPATSAPVPPEKSSSWCRPAWPWARRPTPPPASPPAWARACPAGLLGRCGMWTDCNHSLSRTCPSSSSAPMTRRWPRCATASPMEPPVGGGLALFPAYAQGIHDCHAYWERHRESAHRRPPMVGIGLPARGAGSMD